MRIFIIGSSGYKDKMLKYKEELESQGHEVRIPALLARLDAALAAVEG